MITKNEIRNYIDKIPPAPKALKETISLLQEGELIKASKVAKSDLALSSYLHDLVNRPVYGFSSEVSDVSQIFGILGVNGSQQAVYNYMITLLSPDKWVLFNLNSHVFYELQAKLSKRWEQILKHLKIKDRDIHSAITLLPASIIVTEALFCHKLEDVNLLRTNASLDYNTILKRLSGMDLFDISQEIANKWEMPSEIAIILQASSGIKSSKNKNINELGKWMHLLLFYQLSRPIFINAGLNDFIDFKIDYVQDIYEDFTKVLEVS